MEVRRAGRINNAVSACCCFIFVCSFLFPAFAQDMIKYLPRNEDMDSAVKEYTSLTINSTKCADNTLFQNAADCYQCLQIWMPACNSCCFGSNGNFACSSYGSDDACFSTGLTECSCSALIGAPLTDEDSNCVKKNNAWYCDKDGLSPDKTCFDGLVSSLKNSSDCNIRSNFYKIIEEEEECPLEIGSPCYKYTLSSRVSRCISACNEKAEVIAEKKDCKNKACTAVSYDNICTTAACENIAKNRDFCRYNVTTTETCSELTNQSIDCLVSGVCVSCFKPVDPDFSYKFVAKSRESITLIWQIGSTPQWTAPASGDATAPGYFLYTKVKIFEKSDTTFSNPVFESGIHQKYLGAAFSIFCATHIPKETLTQGRGYVAKIYYYLADTPDPSVLSQKVTLSVKINSLRLILIRIRE